MIEKETPRPRFQWSLTRLMAVIALLAFLLLPVVWTFRERQIALQQLAAARQAEMLAISQRDLAIQAEMQTLQRIEISSVAAVFVQQVDQLRAEIENLRAENRRLQELLATQEATSPDGNLTSSPKPKQP